MVDIKSDGWVAEQAFGGAYDKRVEKRKDDAAAAVQSGKEKKTFQDWKGEGASVTISKESQDFLAGVDERKAAQRAEKERLMAENPVSPFAKNGNIFTLTNMETGEKVQREPAQWLTFSQYLYENDFYDEMSDEEVKRTEDMLKEMTSDVDSIFHLTDSERHRSGMSHEAAGLAMLSSVNALHYFADTFLPERMRDSFKALIGEYENYNRESVAGYYNKDALYSVKHSAGEEAKVKKTYQALFDRLKSGGSEVKDIFDTLSDTLVDYTSGGSRDDAVRKLLKHNSAEGIERMATYWTQLLGE